MFTPTFNVEFVKEAGFVIEVVLKETDSYGKPVAIHVVPVVYDEHGKVEDDDLTDEVNTLLEDLFGEEELEFYQHRINFVVVDDEGYALIYEEDFAPIIEDWIQ